MNSARGSYGLLTSTGNFWNENKFNWGRPIIQENSSRNSVKIGNWDSEILREKNHKHWILGFFQKNYCNGLAKSSILVRNQLFQVFFGFAGTPKLKNKPHIDSRRLRTSPNFLQARWIQATCCLLEQLNFDLFLTFEIHGDGEKAPNPHMDEMRYKWTKCGTSRKCGNPEPGPGVDSRSYDSEYR